jgi:SAM-dependent methyltransferase
VGIVIESLDLPDDCHAYEMSSRGALYAYMRRRFRNFYFSEFYDNVPGGEMRNGTPCQDVQALSLEDGRFDLVTNTEVFEHVPDDMRGFAEVRRVLKAGGHFIFTVPFMESTETLERAVMMPDGRIEHMLPPEYHSDRIRGKGAVLAFRTYGTDLEQRLGRAGFSVEIRKITACGNAVLNQHVIVARRIH